MIQILNSPAATQLGRCIRENVFGGQEIPGKQCENSRSMSLSDKFGLGN